MGHPYFGSLNFPANPRTGAAAHTAAALDFDRVESKGYDPEFKPPKRGEGDTSSFDAEFTSERPVDSVVTTNLTGTQVEKSKFQGFTYEGDSAM